MDEYQKQVAGLQAAQVIEALRRNNMDGYFVERAADVPEQVARLLHDGDTVAVGGSKTLTQTGVLDLLRSGRYRFIDRYAPDIPDMRKVFLDSFAADAYLSSVNAVTLNGELYNVDGNSNRVAAICYGPRSVILVAGVNIIVKDIDAAVTRVKRCAAPANAARLGCDTYCAKTGACMGLRGDMASGCKTSARICCSYVVSAYQREKGRIKVILVGEELGY